MSPKITEIGLIRNNKKKTNKISQISYFFPIYFLVHRKVRSPPKVSPKPTSIHIYMYIYIHIYIYIYIYEIRITSFFIGTIYTYKVLTYMNI